MNEPIVHIATYNFYTKHFPIWGIFKDKQWHNDFGHAVTRAMWYVAKMWIWRHVCSSEEFSWELCALHDGGSCVGNCRPPTCRPSGVSDRGFPIVPHLIHYWRSPYFNTLWKTAMRHVIRRISGRSGEGGLFWRKSHHRKWHSRYFLYVTVWERERFEMR